MAYIGHYRVNREAAPAPLRVTVLAGGGGSAGPTTPPPPAAVIAHAPVPPVVPVAAPQPPVATAKVRRPAAKPVQRHLRQATIPSQATTAATTSPPGTGDGVGAGNGSGVGIGRTVGTGGGEGTDIAASAMAAYLSVVRERIERAKQYPPMARRRGLQGRAAVAFEITRQGEPQHVEISFADHPLLGDAARQAVTAAAPFPALPAGLQLAALRIEVPLRFTIQDSEENEE